MKKLILPLLVAASFASCAQQNNSTGGGLFKKASDILNKSKGGSGLSTDEIVTGLKEALSVGAQNSSSKLSAVDGFFANAAIKVLMPSGLQYQIIKEGTGAKPALTDKVKVHYEGKLINGKIFDSSIQRGEPIELNVNGVIPGWTEALQLMPVGSKWKLFIPSDLGYGDNGAGADIKPGSTLVFDVELLDIVK